MVRITDEIKTRMVEMRKSGRTYTEICNELGVTKERCIAYLKDIKPDQNYISAISKDWMIAETEAPDILKKMGFSEIHNLNQLCSFPPFWDYLAKRDDKWWLIDVTINGQKSISAKRDAICEGYSHAILLKTDSEWKFIKISMNVENTIPI